MRQRKIKKQRDSGDQRKRDRYSERDGETKK